METMTDGKGTVREHIAAMAAEGSLQAKAREQIARAAAVTLKRPAPRPAITSGVSRVPLDRFDKPARREEIPAPPCPECKGEQGVMVTVFDELYREEWEKADIRWPNKDGVHFLTCRTCKGTGVELDLQTVDLLRELDALRGRVRYHVTPEAGEVLGHMSGDSMTSKRLKPEQFAMLQDYSDAQEAEAIVRALCVRSLQWSEDKFAAIRERYPAGIYGAEAMRIDVQDGLPAGEPKTRYVPKERPVPVWDAGDFIKLGSLTLFARSATMNLPRPVSDSEYRLRRDATARPLRELLLKDVLQARADVARGRRPV